MKQLFHMQPTLDMTNFQTFRWFGRYEVQVVSDTHYHCLLEAYRFQIIAEHITVDILATNGFSLTCKNVQKVELTYEANV